MDITLIKVRIFIKKNVSATHTVYTFKLGELTATHIFSPTLEWSSLTSCWRTLLQKTDVHTRGDHDKSNMLPHML